MSDTTSLLAHIQALNAKTLAWVAEAPESRWACTITEDLAHWAEYGIFTPAQFDHYMLVSSVFEYTREVWGYKPSWKGLMESTDEELRKELDSLSRQAQEQYEWQLAEDARREAEEQLERDSTIAGELQFTNGHWNVA